MESISNADFQIIYHTAAIHEGSSGGALVDVDGNLLGLNTWGLDTSDEYSFAVPNYIIYMFLINNGVIE
jgi:S1-C subfamily serine protease